MGSRALENRIKRLKAIEAQQKELEQQAEAIKAEIKNVWISSAIHQRAI